MKEQKSNRVPFALKLGYGIGSLGEGIGYNVFYSFFIFFLTTIAGVRPAIAGTISMIAVIWDAVTDPMIGTWSDNTKNKIGRRRPFVMFGSILCGLSIVLLFFHVNLPDNVKTAYYILINILFWSSMTACVIPHISLGTDLTDDYNGRTGVRAYATLMLNTGTLIATSATLMIVKFYSTLFLDSDRAWLFTGITYGVLVVFAYQVSCFTLRGKEPPNPNLSGQASSKKINLAEVFKGYLRTFQNKSLLSLLVATLVTNLVVGAASSLVVFIFTYLYGYDEVQSSGIYLYQGILYVVFVPVATWISNQFGKKYAMAFGQACYSVGYLVMFFLPATKAVLFLNLTVAALGNVIYWTLLYSMTYDTTLIDRFQTDEDPTGLYVSMIGLVMKIGTSVGMFVVGIGLDVIGFDSEALQQTEAALSGLKTLYSLLPGAMLLIGAAAMLKYGLTEQKYNDLLAAYEKKQKNQPYDISTISDLL